MSEERLSALIARIYDASLDAQQWPRVLAEARDFVGGRAASIVSKNIVTNTSPFRIVDDRYDARFEQSYFEKYIAFDPCSVAQFFAEIEQPMAMADLMGQEEFRETRFYREWVKPQGLIDCTRVVLSKASNSFTMFTVFRHESDGIVDAGTTRRMRLIAPHLRRAALTLQLMEKQAAQSQKFASVLDAMSAAVFLLDSAGCVVHANRSGHAMLADHCVLRIVDGRLKPSNPRLPDLSKDLSRPGRAELLGDTGLPVVLTDQTGTRYIAHTVPLTSAALTFASETYRAATAMFVYKASIDAPLAPEIIARTFNLTPSELRVMLAIARMGGVAETAKSLGIAETTVKSHLQRVFTKTNSSRQADLVRLVAEFSHPLIR